MKKVLVFSAALLFFLLLCKNSIMVPKATVDNTVSISAWVEEVKVVGEADIILVVKNDPAQYYIKRGIERGISIENLEQKLEQQKVTLSYIDRWSILYPSKQKRHLSSIKVGEEQVYSEFAP